LTDIHPAQKNNNCWIKKKCRSGFISGGLVIHNTKNQQLCKKEKNVLSIGTNVWETEKLCQS
jgi:hypothetical protein